MYATGFLVMAIKRALIISPKAGQRVFNKMVIQMRVPIENGSGYFNQVSDFIKLPAA